MLAGDGLYFLCNDIKTSHRRNANRGHDETMMWDAKTTVNTTTTADATMTVDATMNDDDCGCDDDRGRETNATWRMR